MSLCCHFLVATADENDDALAVFSEVNAVAGSEVDLVLEYTGTYAPDLREIPSPSRARAMVTFVSRNGAKRIPILSMAWTWTELGQPRDEYAGTATSIPANRLGNSSAEISASLG